MNEHIMIQIKQEKDGDLEWITKKEKKEPNTHILR